jgi:hypothetical protein
MGQLVPLRLGSCIMTSTANTDDVMFVMEVTQVFSLTLTKKMLLDSYFVSGGKGVVWGGAVRGRRSQRGHRDEAEGSERGGGGRGQGGSWTDGSGDGRRQCGALDIPSQARRWARGGWQEQEEGVGEGIPRRRRRNRQTSQGKSIARRGLERPHGDVGQAPLASYLCSGYCSLAQDPA